MVVCEGILCRDSQDFPACGPKPNIPVGIASSNFRHLMDSTVDLDHEARLCDREVDNDAIDRMLAAHGEAVLPQCTQSLPGNIFRRVG